MKALAITIDVEADAGFDGACAIHDPLAFVGVNQGLLKLIAEVPEASPLTLLISHEVETNPNSISLLKSLFSDHELGLHLHPDDAVPGTARSVMFCNLNWAQRTSLLQERICAFYVSYHVMPTSVRLGRFGLTLATLQRLAEAGLTADCSIAPGILRDQGVDHRNLSNEPVVYADEKFRLVSFPTTVVGDCWIRPSFCTIPQIREAMGSVDYGVAMWSSSELVPGRSPYTKSDHDVEEFLDKVRFIAQWAQENDVPIVRLSEMVERYFLGLDTAKN